jgi:hypothetical protein
MKTKNKHIGSPSDAFATLRTLAKSIAKKHKTNLNSLCTGDMQKHRNARDEFCYEALRQYDIRPAAAFLRRNPSTLRTCAERYENIMQKRNASPDAATLLRAYCHAVVIAKDEPLKHGNAHRKTLCNLLRFYYYLSVESIADMLTCHPRTASRLAGKRALKNQAETIAKMNEFIERINNAKS